MTMLEKLRNRLAQAEARLGALIELAEVENRDLSAEENTEVDTLAAEIGNPQTGNSAATGLYAQIERAETLEVMANRRMQPQAGLAPPPRNAAGNTGGRSPGGRQYAVPRAHNRLRAFANAQDAYDAGLWFFAEVMGASWARNLSRSGVANAGQVAGTDADGGYLVPDLLQAAIIQVREQVGVARRVCQVVPMGGEKVNWPKELAGQTVYYPDEGGDITESKATLSSVALSAVRRAVLTGVSNQLADDAIVDVIDWVANRAGYQLARNEDVELILGDGTSTYGSETGLITACGAAGKVTLASTKTAFSDITEANLHAVMGIISDNYWNDMTMRWIMRRSTWSTVIMPLILAMGGTTATEMVNGVPRPMLMGYPVEFTGAMPASAAAKFGLFFGNFFDGVMIGDRRRITMEMSREAGFIKDVTYLKIQSRYDINVHAAPGSSVAYGAYAGIITAAS